MAIRRQDLAVLLFYFLGYSKIRNLCSRLRGQAISRFVTFHDLPRDSLPLFEANLGFLKKYTNVVSLSDFMQGHLSTTRLNVVLTFDDGYKSWATSVAPILKSLNLPATFFVASGFVGASKEQEAAYMRTNLLLSPDVACRASGLSEDDIRGLARDGFTIGGHTVSHRNLSTIFDSDEVRHEIREDRRRLATITGAKIDYFAYPFGACQNPRIDLANILRESGYIGAVTTASGSNTQDSDRFLLHRELTPASLSKWVFRARAYGNYDAVRFLKRRLG